MRFRQTVLGAFTLAIFLFLAPSQVTAGNASRIELKNGTVFENVLYKVDNEYKVITIQQGDDKRNISFSDVAVIQDSSGRDVTVDVLDLDYPPPGTGERPITPIEAARPPRGGRKHPYSFAIHAQPNFSLPIGDYYEGFTSGIGYGADISIPVSREIAIRGTVSRSGMRPDNGLAPGVSFSAWRYVISVQYYKWPRWRTDGKTMYFVYSGIGGISHTLSAGGESADFTKLTTVLGFGLMQQVSRNIGIEAGGEFDAVYIGASDYRYSYYGNVEYAWIMDFKLGLVLLW
jgi:hypothetical protein